MQTQGEFRFPRKRDLKKQGKFGSDVPAAREALYSCMRKRGNGADEPKSPPLFSNEIRIAIHDDRQREKNLRPKLR